VWTKKVQLIYKNFLLGIQKLSNAPRLNLSVVSGAGNSFHLAALGRLGSINRADMIYPSKIDVLGKIMP